MFGILARAMIGVVASASPELVGPQIACTLAWLIISCVGVHRLGRIALGVAGDDFDLAALDAAGGVDRIDREVHAAVEADGRAPSSGRSVAASQPMRTGSLSASAGRASEAAASAPAVPSVKPRRVNAMDVILFLVT